MNRRALLGTIATTGITGVAGCLSDTFSETGSRDGEETGYDECTAPYVEYDHLPDEIAAEVDIAFEDGTYVTDGVLLYEQAVSDGTPLWRGGAPYYHWVERDGDTRRLSFDRQTEYSSPRDLEITNDTAEPISVTAIVTDENGERVVDEQLDIDPGGRVRREAASRFGTYDVVIELEDGRRETASWDLSAPKVEVVEALLVSITEEELSIRPLVASYDYEPCPMQWGAS